MYILLTLFFISLIGIAFILGRKLAILRNGKIPHRDRFFLKPEHIEEIKRRIIKKLKIYGYNGLVVTIRMYVVSANFLKKNYQELKLKIQEIRAKRKKTNPDEQKEVNKFLKVISEYKHKVGQIKHRIIEEEEGL